jgi:hypothetical protein
VIGVLAAPTSTTNVPVATLPLCVAVQVTGFAAPVGLVRVPDQEPARLSAGAGAGEGAGAGAGAGAGDGAAEGAVPELPHAARRSVASNDMSPGIRTLVRNMIGCSKC